MSSATSIKRRAGAPRVHAETRTPQTAAAERTKDAGDQAPEDAGFRPWHFFVLVSLMAATAAVMMSRRATPEHLIMMSLTIGAAGAAAAGLYRMLAPLAADDVSIFTEPLTDRSRAALEPLLSVIERTKVSMALVPAWYLVDDAPSQKFFAMLTRARAIAQRSPSHRSERVTAPEK